MKEQEKEEKEVEKEKKEKEEVMIARNLCLSLIAASVAANTDCSGSIRVFLCAQNQATHINSYCFVQLCHPSSSSSSSTVTTQGNQDSSLDKYLSSIPEASQDDRLDVEARCTIGYGDNT